MDGEYHERDYYVNTQVIEFGKTITSVVTLGQRVKQRREELGLSQEQLAKAAGGLFFVWILGVGVNT